MYIDFDRLEKCLAEIDAKLFQNNLNIDKK